MNSRWKHSLRGVLSALLVNALALGCVTNPARRLEPNTEEVAVKADLGVNEAGQKVEGHFKRGNEVLDEEEFYSVIGDKASFDEVHGSRSTGELLQGLGVTLLAIGVAALIGGFGSYFLSTPHGDGTPATLPIAEETRQIPLYGGIVGGVLALGGGYLLFGNQDKARGVPMVFDLKHAQASLEKSLYGDSGISAEHIAKLALATASGNARLCSTGGTEFKPLAAFDAQGRAVKITDRDDWFTWTASNPRADFYDVFGTADDEDGSRKVIARGVNSPLTHSLAGLEEDVSVTVTATQSGVKGELVLQHDLTCEGSLDFSGASGSSGSSGKGGRSGSRGSDRSMPQRGGSGGDGRDGEDGAQGPEVSVEAAWVTSATHGRLLLVVASDGNGTRAALIDPKSQARVHVVSSGGDGGRGGRGGGGGDGGDGGPFNSCQAGGDGGDGGRGGRGGRGGSGGNVTIKVTDAALKSLVSAEAHGGAGGRGGGGGSAGGRGSRGSCKKGFASEGARGNKGQSGPTGPEGSSGSTRLAVSAASELHLVAEMLATNPALSLEAGTSSPATTPKPKHKRR